MQGFQLLFLLYSSYDLNVCGPWELVDWCGFDEFVAAGSQVFDVAGKGAGIARDIDDAIGLRSSHCGEESLVTAGTRRVEYRHVCVVYINLRQFLFCLTAEIAGVDESVNN